MTTIDLRNLEVWDNDREKQLANDRRGMCNTASGLPVICVLGGIGCNVNHDAVELEMFREAVYDSL